MRVTVGAKPRLMLRSFAPASLAGPREDPVFDTVCDTVIQASISRPNPLERRTETLRMHSVNCLAIFLTRRLATPLPLPSPTHGLHRY